ncbi:MAG: lipocalin-like domain-containing protein [Steroidobacteraceae bacterium]
MRRPLPAHAARWVPSLAVSMLLASGGWGSADDATPVLPTDPVELPRDHGSHPSFRTEWWYVTGWLKAGDQPLGFQVTFFRSRTSPSLLQGNPSHFAPAQIIVAHAALSDPGRGHLLQQQKVARAGLGLAGAAEHDIDAWIGDWRLRRAGDSLEARVRGEEFALALTLRQLVPALLNGDRGFSQKGPDPRSASHYYSLPQLRVTGSITRGQRTQSVQGDAWLDHEWSSEYLDAQATGWDWTGLNLQDGSALMAFRIRGANGSTRWAGGTLRAADGRMFVATPAQVEFQPLRRWRSPRTGIDYPVQWALRIGAQRWELSPLMDDQENDTRATTGAIYWEGAVRALRDSQEVGHGYLELTGYEGRLILR